MYAERSEPTRPPEAARSRAAGKESPALPQIAVRGRSVLALVVAPEPPLEVWLSALDAQLATAPDFFAGRPVIADLTATHAGSADAEPVLAALSARSVRGRPPPCAGRKRRAKCGASCAKPPRRERLPPRAPARWWSTARCARAN